MPVTVPSGVEVISAGDQLTVKGPKGTLERSLPRAMTVVVEDGSVSVTRPTESSNHRSLHGLTRTLIANMVEGVSKGFAKELELVGVGFRANKAGNDLVLSLGYSHPIRYTPPEGVDVSVPAPTQVVISGANKEVVGEVAAKIRSFRKPEPYKGKGVLYKGEVLRRKAGKSGKAGKTAK
jgi:large subunit ribosomal protein L6